ncbi:pectinesterase inhibitor 4-like [Arachis duranensis]|uniref:pectinesterase n=1 Tax=Arachis duranensis TaxID=130453 RepID=A0A6P4CKP6_ARADU|nr:pectinesterase inhibitor 4-like [Arachis duranensis]
MDVNVVFPRSSATMHYPVLLLLVLLSISNSCSSAVSSSPTNNYQNTPDNTQTYYYKSYIKSSCNTTTYPSICYKNLNRYALSIQADPFLLCNTSLGLAFKAARSASSTVSKILKNNSSSLTPPAKAVVRDCYGNLKDSVGQIKDSISEMGNLYESSDKDFKMSNIKTWVSAAITNYNTCSDGFEEQSVDADVRDKINKLVLNAARMTSNALYFINHLVY